MQNAPDIVPLTACSQLANPYADNRGEQQLWCDTREDRNCVEQTAGGPFAE
ncbi:hypothetical protein GCM10010461_26250 [Microbacterium aurantiacum]